MDMKESVPLSGIISLKIIKSMNFCFLGGNDKFSIDTDKS